MVTTTDVKALTCPSCGAAITLRTGAQAQVVVCPSCHAVLDAKDPNLAVLQKFAKRMTVTPIIPLGTRGSLKGDAYEVVGFQERYITADGERYAWREYLLWNPHQGYRYLSEYDGHWNDIVVTKTPPVEDPQFDPAQVEFHGETFKHFQTAVATTDFILGEFPWLVKVGDTAKVRDFVSPPDMLSEERTKDEVTWSFGTYTSPESIWEAFSLPGSPPSPRGTFENQPDNYAPSAAAFTNRFGIFLGVLVLMFFAREMTAANQEFFSKEYFFRSPGGDSAAFVTEVFPITGRTSNVEVHIHAGVSNSWAYFDLALINDQTGKAIDLGREVSYYSGYDSDGSWSEGSNDDRSLLPAVPPGNYFLRVEPTGPTGGEMMAYSITLKRDVPSEGWFLIAFALLAIVPLVTALRAWGFEVGRWKESDHPMIQTDGDDS
jgi:hypothetical protein